MTDRDMLRVIERAVDAAVDSILVETAGRVPETMTENTLHALADYLISTAAMVEGDAAIAEGKRAGDRRSTVIHEERVRRARERFGSSGSEADEALYDAYAAYRVDADATGARKVFGSFESWLENREAT